MKWLAGMTAVVGTATLTSAKSFTAQAGRKGHNVQLSSSEDLCVFENFDDSWCIAATPPMVKAGWEWAQAYTSTSSSETPVLKYYQVELQPYLQIQANLISTLFIQNVWVNELTFDLDQFKTNLYISMILNEEFDVCPGLGWESEVVLFKLVYAMKFWNCSKTLVNDLADFSSTWTGYEAKYFEECSQSNNAEIELISKTYRDAKTDQTWIGTTDAKSVKYCYSAFGTPSYKASRDDPAILLAKMAYKNFFNYVT